MPSKTKKERTTTNNTNNCQSIAVQTWTSLSHNSSMSPSLVKWNMIVSDGQHQAKTLSEGHSSIQNCRNCWTSNTKIIFVCRGSSREATQADSTILMSFSDTMKNSLTTSNITVSRLLLLQVPRLQTTTVSTSIQLEQQQVHLETIRLCVVDLSSHYTNVNIKIKMEVQKGNKQTFRFPYGEG